jgi:hypothetical protein
MIDRYNFKKETNIGSSNKKDETPGITEIKIDDKIVKVDFKVIDKNVVMYGAAKIY